jgi:tetratricopeptide (TPR) repeat protein
MKGNRATTGFISLLLIAALVASVLENNRLESIRPAASLEETMYITSPVAVRHFSLGYTGLLADIYWTRAVQYFGRKAIQRSERFDLLKQLLDMTTALDPHLIVAYDFGSTFLAQSPPLGAGDPDGAIALVERGIRDNPNEWGLYRDLAFIYYFEKKNYAKAGEAMEKGSEVPNAHPFSKAVAATLMQRGGSIEAAKVLWLSIVQTTKDDLTRDNAVKHLRALQVDETVPRLEAAVEAYQRKTGALPRRFQELMYAGLLPEVPLDPVTKVPVDPIGNPYNLTPDGRVEVEDYISLPFITKGLPPGVQPSLFDYSASKSHTEQNTPKR